MPIFECSAENCKAMENTALCDYWYRKVRLKEAPICSECSTGTWHGKFEKRTAEEAGYVQDDRGYYGPQPK